MRKTYLLRYDNNFWTLQKSNKGKTPLIFSFILQFHIYTWKAHCWFIIKLGIQINKMLFQTECCVEAEINVVLQPISGTVGLLQGVGMRHFLMSFLAGNWDSVWNWLPVAKRLCRWAIPQWVFWAWAYQYSGNNRNVHSGSLFLFSIVNFAPSVTHRSVPR